MEEKERLVLKGNELYEIDIECEKRKRSQIQKEKKNIPNGRKKKYTKK